MTDSEGPGNQGGGMAPAETVSDESDALKAGVRHSSGFAAKASPRIDFEAVYEAHFDFVWRSVRRLGVDEFGVDDVVQEVFFTAHRRLGDFEGRSSIRTWLFAIVLHVVRHYQRTRQRKDVPAVRSDGPRDPDTVADAGRPGPHESAERGDTVRLLDQLLQELDDDKREVFVLAELAQMTATEIGEVLRTSVNTIYSRLRAARQEFEQALARHRAREARRHP